MGTRDQRQGAQLSDVIVLVDDEPVFRATLKFVLESAGFTVIDEADGLSGLAAVYEHRPKVALLDIMLPGMAGDYVCAEVRADSELDGIFIAAMTAMEENDARELLKDKGADVLLPKPTDNDAIVALCKEVLAGRLVSTAGKARPADSPTPDN